MNLHALLVWSPLDLSVTKVASLEFEYASVQGHARWIYTEF